MSGRFRAHIGGSEEWNDGNSCNKVKTYAYGILGKRGYFFIKADMEKAYDRVSWNFLEAMMRLGQGDPLSAYLFILCSELLSRLFERECHDNRFKGFKIGRSGHELSHLFFADDLVIFGCAMEENLASAMRILEKYST
ncbi:putative mitochondrial protein [Morus notabilis]|uniref:Putative mitochondrial protein n=1 Tax=Morus notabilis TaxID=981085 RepID=W9SLA6_9ROSA|nr:putative mitochondrial protein [Morus notabilis]